MENINNTTRADEIPEPLILPKTLSDKQLGVMQLEPTDSNIEQLNRQREVLIDLGATSFKSVALGQQPNPDKPHFETSDALKAAYTATLLSSDNEHTKDKRLFGLHTNESGVPSWYVMSGENHGDRVAKPEEHGLPDPAIASEGRQSPRLTEAPTETITTNGVPAPDTHTQIPDTHEAKELSFNKLVKEAREKISSISNQVETAVDTNNKLNVALEEIMYNLRMSIDDMRGTVSATGNHRYVQLIGDIDQLRASGSILDQNSESLALTRIGAGSLEETKGGVGHTDANPDQKFILNSTENVLISVITRARSGEYNNDTIRTQLNFAYREIGDYIQNSRIYLDQGRGMDTQTSINILQQVLEKIRQANDSRNVDIGATNGIQYHLDELKSKLDSL